MDESFKSFNCIIDKFRGLKEFKKEYGDFRHTLILVFDHTPKNIEEIKNSTVKVYTSDTSIKIEEMLLSDFKILPHDEVERISPKYIINKDNSCGISLITSISTFKYKYEENPDDPFKPCFLAKTTCSEDEVELIIHNTIYYQFNEFNLSTGCQNPTREEIKTTIDGKEIKLFEVEYGFNPGDLTGKDDKINWFTDGFTNEDAFRLDFGYDANPNYSNNCRTRKETILTSIDYYLIKSEEFKNEVDSLIDKALKNKDKIESIDCENFTKYEIDCEELGAVVFDKESNSFKYVNYLDMSLGTIFKPVFEVGCSKFECLLSGIKQWKEYVDETIDLKIKALHKVKGEIYSLTTRARLGD